MVELNVKQGGDKKYILILLPGILQAALFKAWNIKDY